MHRRSGSVEVVWDVYSPNMEFVLGENIQSTRRGIIRTLIENGSKRFLFDDVFKLLEISTDRKPLILQSLLGMMNTSESQSSWRLSGFYDTLTKTLSSMGIWLVLFSSWRETDPIQEHFRLACLCSGVLNNREISNQDTCFKEFMTAYVAIFFNSSQDRDDMCSKCKRLDYGIASFRCHVESCSNFEHFGPDGCSNVLSMDEVVFGLICDDKPFFCAHHAQMFGLENPIWNKYYPEHCFRYRALKQVLRLMAQPRWWPLLHFRRAVDMKGVHDLDLFRLHSMVTAGGSLRTRRDLIGRLRQIIESGLFLFVSSERPHIAAKSLRDTFNFDAEIDL